MTSRDYADEQNAEAMSDALLFTGCCGAAEKSGDVALDLSSFHRNQVQDVERKTFGLDTIDSASEDEVQYHSRSNIGSFDLDNALIDSVNKLNLLKKELFNKRREILSLRCQLDDVPVLTELIQYERRLSELYAQIQERHLLTRKHFATYNALLEVKDLMLKEISLLDSIDSQFKDAINAPTGQYELVNSMEVIVKGTKCKLEKAKKNLLSAQKLCDNLREKHMKALADEHHFAFLLKSFKDACSKFAMLQELTSA